MPFSIKNNNAIKNVLFVFEHLPLSQESLKDLAENSQVKEVLSEFPKRAISHALKIDISAQESSFASPQQQYLSGVSFERFGPDGRIECGISIQENATMIMCGSYDSWTSVWTRVAGYLRILVPYVFSKTTVINIILQYVDEFESDGEKSTFNVNEVLSTSKYFSTSVLESGGVGHCHTGFYENTEGINGKVLHNLNMNITENAKQFIIQITAAHKAHLNSHLNAISIEDFADAGQIHTLFDALHEKHKIVIGEIFSAEAKNKIGFNDVVQGG